MLHIVMSDKTGIEVKVVDWKNGTSPEVAIFFIERDEMFTVSADGARHLAFMLMECADYIVPPFDTSETQDEDYTPDEDS